MAFGITLITRSGLPAGLNASRGVGGGAGASTTVWASSGVTLRGASGSLATGIGSTLVDPLLGLPISSRVQSLTFGSSSARGLL